MWFFNRKKKNTVIIPELDRGLLAEAISIHLNVFEKAWQQYKKIEGTININDKVTIKMTDAHSGHLFNEYYDMHMGICLENILVSSYYFTLQIGDDFNNYPTEKYRRWTCNNVTIYHNMPYWLINVLNEWSMQIVTEFKCKQTEEKHNQETQKRNKYEEEEMILSKYWQ